MDGRSNGGNGPPRKEWKIPFLIREIHNQIKAVISKGDPGTDKRPQSQLQGGILHYLYGHREECVYQKDIEREFRISGATASNTLQVMEKNGLIVRRTQDKDARLKRIQMSEEAAANHARMEDYMEMMTDRMLEGMTAGEVTEFSRLLHLLGDNLERLEAELEAGNGSRPDGQEVCCPDGTETDSGEREEEKSAL